MNHPPFEDADDSLHVALAGRAMASLDEMCAALRRVFVNPDLGQLLDTPTQPPASVRVGLLTGALLEVTIFGLVYEYAHVSGRELFPDEVADPARLRLAHVLAAVPGLEAGAALCHALEGYLGPAYPRMLISHDTRLCDQSFGPPPDRPAPPAQTPLTAGAPLGGGDPLPALSAFMAASGADGGAPPTRVSAMQMVKTAQGSGWVRELSAAWGARVVDYTWRIHHDTQDRAILRFCNGCHLAGMLMTSYKTLARDATGDSKDTIRTRIVASRMLPDSWAESGIVASRQLPDSWAEATLAGWGIRGMIVAPMFVSAQHGRPVLWLHKPDDPTRVIALEFSTVSFFSPAGRPFSDLAV